MADTNDDPDVIAAKTAVEWWRNAKRRAQWLPLVFAATMIVLHWIIEANYLVNNPGGPPTAHPPLFLDILFRVAVLATLLVAIFCFPRWQSIVAFFGVGFLICSLGGR